MRRVPSALLFLVLSLSSACGFMYFLTPQESRLAMTGRYSELAAQLESRIGDPPATKDLYQLCDAYQKLRRYDKILNCADRLEVNVKRGDRFSGQVDLAHVPPLIRSGAYIDLGDYDRAIEEARKTEGFEPKGWGGLQSTGKDTPRRALLSSLSLAYALKGDHQNARRYLARVEDLDLPWTLPLVVAPLYMALGEFDKSLAIIERVRPSTSLFVDVAMGSFWVGESLSAGEDLPRQFMLSKSLHETGRVREAKQQYTKLLANRAARDSGEIYWQVHFELGRIAESEGNAPEAIKLYQDAIDAVEQQRSTINTMASKIGYIGDKQKVYARLIAQRQKERAFEYVERAKSRALVDLLASRGEFVVKGPEETEVKSALDRLDALELEARAEGANGTAAETERRNIAIAETKAKLRHIAPELASLVTVTPPSTPDIQARFSTDETLLEYYYANQDLYAFVLTRDSLDVVKLDGSDLAPAVQRLRLAIEDPGGHDHEAVSAMMYDRLLRPLDRFLTTARLIIVPHGVLHHVPFNALNAGVGAVIDRWSVRYLPSASVVKYLPDRRRPLRGGVLVLGNPALAQPGYQLRYAEQEAVRIGGTLQESRVLVGKDATETSFRKMAREFKYLHLATHGRFESDSPLTSGLFLARDTENDGVLTVGEVYSLRLNAILVTLSACETGLGKINHGDDVVGLTRGFLYAGASAVVASLWRVDDEATLHLMGEFYANLNPDLLTYPPHEMSASGERTGLGAQLTSRFRRDSEGSLRGAPKQRTGIGAHPEPR